MMTRDLGIAEYRKLRTSYLFVLLSVWLLVNSGIAVALESGATGNALLRIGIGARATAMGDTFVGIADDVSATYWNPAGINQIERPQLSAMHAEWLAETHYEWLGFVQRLGPWLSLGVDVGYLYTGEITRTVETGIDTYRTDGFFGYTNQVIRLAVGSGSYRNLRAGMSVQVFRQELTFTQTRNRVPERTADSTSMTLGVLYEPPISWVRGGAMSTLRVGASLQNVRGKADGLIRKDDDLPTVLKLGGALHLKPALSPLDEEADAPKPTLGTMTIAADLNFPNDRPFALHTGLEYHFPNGFALRSGYRTGTDFDFLSSWSFGTGYASSGYQIDYAITPFDRLGNSHRVSMKLEF